MASGLGWCYSPTGGRRRFAKVLGQTGGYISYHSSAVTIFLITAYTVHPLPSLAGHCISADMPSATTLVGRLPCRARQGAGHCWLAHLDTRSHISVCSIALGPPLRLSLLRPAPPYVYFCVLLPRQANYLCGLVRMDREVVQQPVQPGTLVVFIQRASSVCERSASRN